MGGNCRPSALLRSVIPIPRPKRVLATDGDERSEAKSGENMVRIWNLTS